MDRSSNSVLDALDLNSLFFSIAAHTSPLATTATTSSSPFQTETITDMVIKDLVCCVSWYIRNKHCIQVSFDIVRSDEVCTFNCLPSQNLVVDNFVFV